MSVVWRVQYDSRLLSENVVFLDDVIMNIVKDEPFPIEERYVIREKLRIISSHIAMLERDVQELNEPKKKRKLFRRK